MFRQVLSHKSATQSVQITSKRFASYHLDGPLPKRPLKKISVGKARPAIYYKFNCSTEFSDGSVIKRRSVFPKHELRLIQDQKNSPLWNPNRSDLEVVDANAGGRLEKFKQKFGQFNIEDTSKDKKDENSSASAEKKDEDDSSSLLLDDYLDLLSQNAQQVQKGGKLATKQKKGKK